MNVKVVGYWAATSIVVLELLIGGLADLGHGRILLVAGQPVAEVITHLGYPLYVLTLLGGWKLLGAIALSAPRFPRLKEWAYAGVIFDMTGAIASGLARGDDVSTFIWPLIVIVLTFVSWGLRPPSRILGVLLSAQTGQRDRRESHP